MEISSDCGCFNWCDQLGRAAPLRQCPQLLGPYGVNLLMVSAIDPTKPVDGVPAGKANLRANL
jgi:hypothetical protein